jgi:aldehyde dehydrogenase (NAD+)
MRFDKIVFTGSTQKGKLVASAAGRNLVPCLLELGGKSPCIVDNTADASYAAKKILFGKLTNCGQICVAPDYIFIHQSKYEEWLKAMKENL